MAAKYILRQNEEGKFTFTLHTHGGQLLLTSPDYADKVTAMSRINAARHLAGTNKNYQLLTGEGGQPYFVITNKHKEVVAQSELYPDMPSMSKGINLVKANARAAKLEDLTGEK
jgi:uncharacterized protein YegP (UPF0339 family)